MLEYEFKKSFYVRGRKGFDLEAADSMGLEFTVLFGPSGSGKSTLLNILSGITKADHGRATLNGVTLFDSDRQVNIPLRKRRIGYVFQDLALFPHLNTVKNIAYGIPNGKSKESRIRELVSQLGLEGQEWKLPQQLSGGQQQRVAIARTLAAEPDLIMMDEPLSALDEPTREHILWDISTLKDKFAIPILYVTHNLREAYSLADRIVVVDQGRVIEIGSKNTVLEKPSHYRTAQCIGVENLFSCRIIGIENGEMVIAMGETRIALEPDSRFAPGQKAYLGVSPPNVRLVGAPDERPNVLNTIVHSIMERKNIMVVHLKIVPNGPMLVADLRKHVFPRWGLKSGSTVLVSLAKSDLFLCHE